MCVGLQTRNGMLMCILIMCVRDVHITLPPARLEVCTLAAQPGCGAPSSASTAAADWPVCGAPSSASRGGSSFTGAAWAAKVATSHCHQRALQCVPNRGPARLWRALKRDYRGRGLASLRCALKRESRTQAR